MSQDQTLVQNGIYISCGWVRMKSGRSGSQMRAQGFRTHNSFFPADQLSKEFIQWTGGTRRFCNFPHKHRQSTHTLEQGVNVARVSQIPYPLGAYANEVDINCTPLLHRMPARYLFNAVATGAVKQVCNYQCGIQRCAARCAGPLQSVGVATGAVSLRMRRKYHRCV